MWALKQRTRRERWFAGLGYKTNCPGREPVLQNESGSGHSSPSWANSLSYKTMGGQERAAWCRDRPDSTQIGG